LDNSENNWRAIIEDLPILKVALNMSVGQLFTCTVLVLALYVGGSTAYVLGVVIGLPSSVATLVNHATIVHLSSQLAFISLIIFTLFKVSRLIVTGIVIWSNFLICKFYFGPKRPRGLRNPTVSRMQRRMNNAVVEGRSHRKIVLAARIIIAFAFFASTFFALATGKFTTQPLRVALYCTIFLGVSANRVGLLRLNLKRLILPRLSSGVCPC